MSMAEKLAYIKKLRHLTAEEIARRSGVPLGTLNKIFSGQTKNPAAGPVDRIAQVLHVPVHYLLDDTLPPECNISACMEDGGVLLLTDVEIRLVMKYRELDLRAQRAVSAMLDLLRAPPGYTAGVQPVRRTLCYVTDGQGPDSQLRTLLLPDLNRAAREADFAVLLGDGSMEPLYPAGTVLLCRRADAAAQEYGLFLLNREALVRRRSRKRGVTKLVAPNLNFKDIVVRPDDCLECIGVVTGAAHGYRWI